MLDPVPSPPQRRSLAADGGLRRAELSWFYPESAPGSGSSSRHIQHALDEGAREALGLLPLGAQFERFEVWHDGSCVRVRLLTRPFSVEPV
jgi:hypothetical protein